MPDASAAAPPKAYSFSDVIVIVAENCTSRQQTWGRDGMQYGMQTGTALHAVLHRPPERTLADGPTP